MVHVIAFCHPNLYNVLLVTIGTAPGQFNVRLLTIVNTTEIVGEKSACDSTLSLVDNTTYYSTVVVSNGAMNSLSVTATSNGGWCIAVMV